MRCDAGQEGYDELELDDVFLERHVLSVSNYVRDIGHCSLYGVDIALGVAGNLPRKSLGGIYFPYGVIGACSVQRLWKVGLGRNTGAAICSVYLQPNSSCTYSRKK